MANEDPIRIDLVNVPRDCVSCRGVVITTRQRIPVCASCRARGLCGVDERDPLADDVDRIGELLDTARSEVARLTAEVEAVREVVEAARETTTTRAGEMLPVLNRIYAALQALDAVTGDALATPGASSATGSSSEAAASPSTPRGTHERGDG